jgi:hypothetical protein
MIVVEFSSWLKSYYIMYKSNMTGATSGAGTTFHPELQNMTGAKQKRTELSNTNLTKAKSEL